jgi:hypothetical protein
MRIVFISHTEISLALSQNIVDTINSVSVNQVTGVTIGVNGWNNSSGDAKYHISIVGNFSIQEEVLIKNTVENLYGLSMDGFTTNNISIPVVIAANGRDFNQAYQISSTNQARISVSVQIACGLSLSAGQSGTITLEISANGTSGWIYAGHVAASNTGILTLGLSTSQISGGQLIQELPAGYYWRLSTNNISGTPTYTFNGGNEIIY